MRGCCAGCQVHWHVDAAVAARADPDWYCHNPSCELPSNPARCAMQACRADSSSGTSLTFSTCGRAGCVAFLNALTLSCSDTPSLASQVGSVRFSVTLADWIHLIVFKGFWFVCHVVIPVYNFGLFSHRFVLVGYCVRPLPMLPVGVPCRTWGPLFVFMIVGAQYLEETFIVNHIQGEWLCSSQLVASVDAKLMPYCCACISHAGELAHPPPEMHWAGKQVPSFCQCFVHARLACVLALCCVALAR